MFTTIDKAIVAVIMAIVMILQNLGWAPEFMNATWAQSIAAVITPFFVWLWPNKEPEAKPLASRRISCHPGAVLAAIAMAVMLTGCAGTRAAYQAAEGLEETAKVVSEHYIATVSQFNNLDDQGALSDSARMHLQDLVRKTRGPMLSLGELAQAYETITENIAMQDAAMDAEDEAAIAAAEAELERAIAEASVALSDLIDAIDEAVGGSSKLEKMRDYLQERLHELELVPDVKRLARA